MITEPHDLEAEAKRLGSNMSEVCRVADIHRSLFTRWKSGKGGVRFATLKAWNDALDTIRRTKAAEAARLDGLQEAS